MMDTTWTVGLASVISVIVYCLVTKSNKKSSLHNAPPCLPSLPIIGSLPFLGGINDAHINFLNLTKKYGNVYGLYFGSKYFVILNGYEAIREALLKNAVAFADRGKLSVDGVVWQDPGKGISLHPYDAESQAIRQNSISVLKSFGFGSRSIMESRIHIEATHLIEHISSLNGKAWHPARLLECVTLNVVYSLMFGERFAYESELGYMHTTSIHSFADAADAIYDVFPIIMNIPPFKSRLAKHRDIYIHWTGILEDKIKETIAAETPDENFITEYVKLVGKDNITTRELTAIIRDLIIAGTETISGQLNWLLVLLANHLEIQSKLQRDIDSVVERGRLPSLDDKPKLPYLEATLLEVMRMRTALPLGVPRFTTTESKLGEYTIPAKTEILVNLWSAHMDPEVWPEPEIFRPERFLDESGDITKREMMITFSFGKRSCLGEVLARQEMFLLAAAIIQQFIILPPDGEDKVKDKMCFVRALTPEPHTMRLIPRSKTATDYIGLINFECQ